VVRNRGRPRLLFPIGKYEIPGLRGTLVHIQRLGDYLKKMKPAK